MRSRQAFALSLLFCAGFGLSACATVPSIPKDRIVETKVPVAVQPIKATDIPAVPAPLGPRPPTLRQQADTLLGKWCEAVGYFLQADPLLRLSAGEKAAPLPRFPECEKKAH